MSKRTRPGTPTALLPTATAPAAAGPSPARARGDRSGTRSDGPARGDDADAGRLRLRHADGNPGRDEERGRYLFDHAARWCADQWSVPARNLISLDVWLESEGAQHDVVEWARAYGTDWERAWNECPRGDWLLGIAARSGVDKKQIVLAAAACARLALEPIDPREERPLRGIEAAESWANGVGDIELCRALAGELDRTRVEDPALSCALASAHAALLSVDSPDSAPASAANAVQGALMSAGDCALMSILSYVQKTAAAQVRVHIPFDLIRPVADSRG